MTHDETLWLALICLSASTFLTRGSFIMLGDKGKLPPTVQQVLRYAPAAALAALIAPDLWLQHGHVHIVGNPKWWAGLAVIAVTLWRPKPWLAFLVGMLVLTVLR